MGERVLLTGATGFLGSHLLHELMQRGAQVTCLVRGASNEVALGRVKQAQSWYFPERRHDERCDAPEVLAADLTTRQLGLDRQTYARIVEECDVIWNAAADVRHIGDEREHFKVNTKAVAHLLELARRGTPKIVHQVSTLSVAGEPQSRTAETFTEEHLEMGQRFDTAYAESKYHAEVLMRSAFAEGTAGAVYRVGHVGPHGETGRFQRNIAENEMARKLRAVVSLRLAPRATGAWFRSTPVDQLTRAMLALAGSGRSNGKTYHLQSPHGMSQAEVMAVLAAVGYEARVVPPSEFEATVIRCSFDDESAGAMLRDDGYTEVAERCIGFSSSERELASCGLSLAPLSTDWLTKSVRHAVAVGFLPPPHVAGAR